MTEPNAEIRIFKRLTDPFARVPNAMLGDMRLSWKCKGIAAYLLGKPLDWRVRVADLINKSKDGRDAVYAGMNELRAAGYMAKRVVRGEDGKVQKTDYLMADHVAFSKDQPLTEIPVPGQPDTALPYPGNPDVSKKEDVQSQTQHKERGLQSGSGYDEEEEETPPPGLSMDVLKTLLLPIFNLPPAYHLPRIELDNLFAIDGKYEDWQVTALVRFYKLPKDSKVPGTMTRKQSLRTLLEHFGEQIGLATRAFPQPDAPAARAPAAPVVPEPEERSEEELQRMHEITYRGKVRAGLVRGVASAQADDAALEIPPRPKLPVTL